MSQAILPVLGLALFPLIGALMLLTGLPAFVALIAAAAIGALAIAIAGDALLLAAIPPRIINLLEGDLFQALPLFVAMGALINRLPLASILFRAGERIAGDSNAGASGASALMLGALLAPMNGSVGASVAMLSRGVAPLLADAGWKPAPRTALIAAASTIGVVIPPSLVLIFLGDAMMGAHTLASGIARRTGQIINTQDVFRSALAPAMLLLLLWLVIAATSTRGEKAGRRDAQPLSRLEWLAAVLAVGFIVTLLGGVVAGMFYAVEAAAMGAVSLLVAGFCTRCLRGRAMADALQEALALSGALFALLVAATTFTLVLRVLGTDRLLSGMIGALPGGEIAAVLAVLAIIMASAFVLDAFEIIFVIVPIVMPGLLVRVPDASWSACLVLLALQTSFLLPPFGYAVMMARGRAHEAISARGLVRAIAPFLAAQIFVIGLCLGMPGMAHLFDPPRIEAQPQLSKDDVLKKFDALVPQPNNEPELPKIE